MLANSDQADADADGVGDACDGCPNDPAKTTPGLCGCGTPDIRHSTAERWLLTAERCLAKQDHR
jgi:hypothetical protein